MSSARKNSTLICPKERPRLTYSRNFINKCLHFARTTRQSLSALASNSLTEITNSSPATKFQSCRRCRVGRRDYGGQRQRSEISGQRSQVSVSHYGIRMLTSDL